MALEVGSVHEGKVTGVQKFGAFIALPEGKSGLCHISEISNSYVADINEQIKLGDIVKVRVIAISPDGKINLSIKKAEMQDQPAAQSTRPEARRPQFQKENGARPSSNNFRQAPPVVSGPSEDKDFESRLKRFMQESDSRIADNPRYADRPRKNRRR